MGLRVGQSSRWLVKSNGRVLGPFSERQVLDLLRDKIIVPLDEVSRPLSRWVYIRDEPIFARVVEEIRIRNLASADDSTTFGEDISAVTQTNSSIDQQPDDLTVEIAQSSIKDLTNVLDVSFKSVDEKDVSQNRDANSEVFVYENDLRAKSESVLTARWVWVGTSVVILMTLCFVVFQRFISGPIASKNLAQQSQKKGIEAFERGDYALALEFFEKAFQIDQKDGENYYYLGILKTQIGNQSFQGRKLLEKISVPSTPNLKDVWVGIGLSYLREGDFKLAEENFNKALDIDPLYSAAVINLGVTAIYQEDWARASNHMLLAVKDGSGDGAEYIMLTEVMRRLFQKEKETRYLEEAQKYLQEHLSRSRNFNFELRIGNLYLTHLLGRSTGIYDEIDKLLQYDFDESDSLKNNILIHRSKADWSVVAQWCLRLTEELDPTARLIAFEGMCLAKSGDIVEANRKIGDSLSMAPKDPVVLSVSAYIENKMNLEAQAGVTIQKALENNKDNIYLQPLRLKALVCQRNGDVECQLNYWRLVHKRDAMALDAISQLATLSFQQGNIPDAKKFLNLGMSVSSRYMPFYELNILISRAEDKNAIH